MPTYPFQRLFALVFTSFVFLSAGTLSAQALPLNKEQVFQVATMAARDGEYEKAIEYFKKVIEIDPRFAPAYNSIGLIYQMWDGGNVAEAARYFRLAVDIDPKYVECWNNLGKIYYGQGSFTNAEQAFLKSLALDPYQPDVDFVMGWIYLLGQSRAEEALAHFQKALPSINNPVIYYGIGLSHLLLGQRFDVMDAITQLRKAGKEDDALRLEKLIRENVKLSSRPGTPLVTGAEGPDSVFDKTLAAFSGGRVEPENKEGIRVRLKGSLPQD